MSRFFAALACLCALLVAPAAFAQTVGGPIQVRTGDAFTVAIDYTQATAFGEQDVEVTVRQVYAVHVLDAEARLWRFLPISLSYDLPEMPGIDASAANVNWVALSDAMSAMMRIATDVGFDCRVDEHGRCLEMTNWPFWVARVENLVMMGDAFARMMPATAAAEEIETTEDGGGPKQQTEETAAASAPTWEQFRQPVLRGIAQLIDNYDGRDAASSFAGIYPPATVQGRALTRRQTVNVSDEYEMPFGAPPMRFTGTMRLERINTRDNTAVVERRVTLDPVSARTSLRSMAEFVTRTMVEPLAGMFPEGQEVPDAAGVGVLLDTLLGDFSYQDTTRGVIDLSTGLARETTTDFTVSMSVASAEEPMVTRGRMVTRVTPGAPAMPRLQRE